MVMVWFLHLAALAVPGYLRLGRWHLPVYAIFAAAGLVAALLLGERSAKQVWRLPQVEPIFFEQGFGS